MHAACIPTSCPLLDVLPNCRSTFAEYGPVKDLRMYEACRAALVSFRSTAAAYKVGWVACLPVAVNRCISAHAVLPSGHRVVSNNSGGVRGALKTQLCTACRLAWKPAPHVCLLSNRSKACRPATVQAFVLLSQTALLNWPPAVLPLHQWAAPSYPWSPFLCRPLCC